MPKVKPETSLARRDEILEAAEICFARQGFHQTTIRDVIRESGLSAGCIYGHFATKEDLIQAISERRHARETALLLARDESMDLDRCNASRTIAKDFLSDLHKKEDSLLRSRKVGAATLGRGVARTKPCTASKWSAASRWGIPALVKLLRGGQRLGLGRQEARSERRSRAPSSRCSRAFALAAGAGRAVQGLGRAGVVRPVFEGAGGGGQARSAGSRRHGRACPGHPRLSRSNWEKDVDARHKAGHDGTWVPAAFNPDFATVNPAFPPADAPPSRDSLQSAPWTVLTNRPFFAYKTDIRSFYNRRDHAMMDIGTIFSLSPLPSF